MPRITTAEILEFEQPIPFAFDERGEPLERSTAGTRPALRWAVRLHTDEGVEGSYVTLWSAPPLARSQAPLIAELLIGSDIFDRERIWDRLNNTLAKTDRIAVGAFDIALWDAAGKWTGLPISALLGRYRDRLPAYVSTVIGSRGLGGLSSPESYRDFADQCAARSIAGFKVHGPSSGSTAAEIATLEAAVEGSAGRCHIMADPGNSLPTLAAGLAFGRICDDLNVFWWEDPVRDNSAIAHKILRERVKTPLLMTEYVRGLDQRMQMILDGGSDFLRADPELDMGITGVLKTAHAAESIGVDVEIHASGPAHRQCMAAIRNTNFYELGLLDPATGSPLHPKVYDCDYRDDLSSIGMDGCIDVPPGPGLGVEYDWELIAATLTNSTTVG